MLIGATDMSGRVFNSLAKLMAASRIIIFESSISPAPAKRMSPATFPLAINDDVETRYSLRRSMGAAAIFTFSAFPVLVLKVASTPANW